MKTTKTTARREAIIKEAVASGKAKIGPGGVVVWEPGQHPRSIARMEFENVLRQAVENEPNVILTFLAGALQFRIYHSEPPTMAETVKDGLQRVGWTVQINPVGETRVVVFAEKKISFPNSKPVKMQLSIEHPSGTFTT